MLRFFRIIRQKLLQKGQFSKYLLYAMGEILLVVIGILIALGINNWNSTRLDKIKEKEILSAIEKELENNQIYFSTLVGVFEKKLATATRLSRYFGSPPPPIEADSFYLYSGMLENIPPFSPKNSILSSIINSSQYELIQNDSIKYVLTDYQSMLNEFEGDIKHQLEAWNRIMLPFISDHISIAQQLKEYVSKNRPSESAFDWNISQVMSNPQFENIIMIEIDYAEFKIPKMKYYIDHMESIRQAISTEIKQ